TAQPYPGAGGTNDPNNINFFAKPNATDPGATNFWRQAQQTGATFTMTGYLTTNADIANNYPAGTAAILQSQTGSTNIKGDGTAQFGQTILVPPSNGGTIAATSWGTVPVKIKEIVTTSGQANPSITS